MLALSEEYTHDDWSEEGEALVATLEGGSWWELVVKVEVGEALPKVGALPNAHAWIQERATSPPAGMQNFTINLVST